MIGLRRTVVPWKGMVTNRTHQCWSRTVGLAVAAAGALLLAAQPAIAVIGGYEPDANDKRFDAVAAFGRTANLMCNECGGPCANNSASGTLIDCEWMLISKHQLSWSSINPITSLPDHPNWYPPDPGYWTVRFRRNPDGSLGTYDTALPQNGACTFHHVAVVEVVRAPVGLDIALARLADPVTHIDPIRVRFESGASLLNGTELLVAGWGKQFHPNSNCESENPSYQLSHRLKIAPVVTTEADPYFVYWASPCSSECECGPWDNDSGGAVLVEFPCGKVEVIAVIATPENAYLVDPLEGSSTFPIPIYDDPCPADLTGDGLVDGGDLGNLLLAWGTPGCGGATPCVADLDCDGDVDGADLGVLLLDWGTCPVGCGGEESLQGFAGEPPCASNADEGEADFVAWAMSASVEELLNWLQTGSWPGATE
jgi:hypothetical protein